MVVVSPHTFKVLEEVLVEGVNMVQQQIHLSPRTFEAAVSEGEHLSPRALLPIPHPPP